MTKLERTMDAMSIALSPICVDTVEDRPQAWTDDKNGWQDGYTARLRVFPDGQREVVVCREKHFVGPAFIGKPRAKRGESENREANDDDAGRRAKKQVRLCCKTIGADRMVTLTYRENMIDRDLALKHFKAFCRRLNKGSKFRYVAVIEQQERGALHFHIAVKGRQMYALLRSIWQRVVGLGPEGQQMGQVNVRDPHKFGFGQVGAHKIASYISKYCSKDMACRVLDQKRYFRSKGIEVPLIEPLRLLCTSMMGAVQSAFVLLGNVDMSGMQSWCNNALGVVWLSTAPFEDPADDDCPF